MKTLVQTITVLTLLAASGPVGAEEGYTDLFNGTDLSGWKAAAENGDSFTVKEGELILKGGRSHLFYVGEDGKAEFKNFELKLKAKTLPGANSGVYFHTHYQEEGWPSTGYEAQVNATHKDPKKTGSLYAVVNIYVSTEEAAKYTKAGENIEKEKAPNTDGEWFDYQITVKDGTITLRVNGETTVSYTEPKDGSLPNESMPGRKLSSGTFALQAHDPDSEVHYKDIRIKSLD